MAQAKLGRAEADLAELKSWQRPEELQRLAALRDEGKSSRTRNLPAGANKRSMSRDMSLHVVERLLGRSAAESTARRMEYPWIRGDRSHD